MLDGCLGEGICEPERSSGQSGGMQMTQHEQEQTTSAFLLDTQALAGLIAD